MNTNAPTLNRKPGKFKLHRKRRSPLSEADIPSLPSVPPGCMPYWWDTPLGLATHGFRLVFRQQPRHIREVRGPRNRITAIECSDAEQKRFYTVTVTIKKGGQRTETVE